MRSSLPVARPTADLSQPCAPPVGLSLATRSPGVGSQPCGAKYPRFCADWCLRCLLLVMCTYLFVKKALTLHLARGEGRERYFGCNLMQRNVLASSHQHLMAEAPDWRGAIEEFQSAIRARAQNIET